MEFSGLKMCDRQHVDRSVLNHFAKKGIIMEIGEI